MDVRSAWWSVAKGDVVRFRPSGHSMKGLVDHRDLVTVSPCDPWAVFSGDIVLARIDGRVYLHRAKRVGERGVLVANASGSENGWSMHRNVVGVATDVEGVPTLTVAALPSRSDVPSDAIAEMTFAGLDSDTATLFARAGLDAQSRMSDGSTIGTFGLITLAVSPPDAKGFRSCTRSTSDGTYGAKETLTGLRPNQVVACLRRAARLQ